MGMAEPRRVAFISLSPVRRREADFAGAEREPPRLEPPQPYREPARAESAPRADAQHPARDKPLPQREVSRAEPPMALQREPPRPEPPPPPLSLQTAPPRDSAARAEPPPRPPKETVRLELVLKDPTDESCVEFSYPELLLCGEQRVQRVPPSRPPHSPGASGPAACPGCSALRSPRGWGGGGRAARRGGSCAARPTWVAEAAPSTPRRAGFPLHLSKPQLFSPSFSFLFPTPNREAPRAGRLASCGTSSVVPVEGKRKNLGGHAPRSEAERLCDPFSAHPHLSSTQLYRAPGLLRWARGRVVYFP